MACCIDHCDPRIPMDNNVGERLIRGPAAGRKNYDGSGADGRDAWHDAVLDSRRWLNGYFEACANSGAEAPDEWRNSSHGLFRPIDFPNCRIRPLATRTRIPPDVDCPSSRSSTSFQAVVAIFVSQLASYQMSRCIPFFVAHKRTNLDSPTISASCRILKCEREFSVQRQMKCAS